jgi:hypothetical protein
MSKIEVNAIEPQCGTNLTVGASGDTITFPSGTTVVNNGSQTGFGRTGTVDWDTTAKTASFTAVSGDGYFVNTTSGAITVTLPASPSAGDIVAVADYASTANTNNITIGRNGSNINGSASDIILSINGKSITLVYVDGTQGWKITDNADQTTEDPAFVTATGGTITCCGDYKIHTFTGPGTFTVTNAGNITGSNSVDYLVVAGGGGVASGQWVGGGGAGGFRESSGAASGCYSRSPLGACVSALPVSVQGYPITVGGGGAGGDPAPGTVGANSVFSTITSTGGGFSGTYSQTGSAPTGGSGAGGTANTQTGGAGNTPPVSPPQGNPGGGGSGSGGGGGGGATAAGTSKTGADPGPSATPGGAGAATSITSSSVTYAAGGRGGGDAGLPAPANGTTNRGNGGSRNASTPGAGTAGGSGGSGIVIIRYKFQ